MGVKLVIYTEDIHSKPLGVQFELLGKQQRNFARVSKDKSLTQKEKIALLAAWESCTALRNQVVDKIMFIKNSCSLN